MKEIRISRTGGGDFTSVQAAVDSIPDGKEGLTVLTVEAGVYYEKLRIDKPDLRITGEGEVRFVYDDYAPKPGSDGKPMGTFASCSTSITGDNIRVDNIIFENTAGGSGKVGQAVALYVDADKAVFRNCTFLAAQDTLYLGKPKEEKVNRSGRNYFEHCRITGDIDFIFGSATAYFHECEIISLDLGKEINGYVTAAATPEDKHMGFVFHKCRLVSDAAENSVYLGRPWRDYARTVFVDCWLGGHIRREGWDDWGKDSVWNTVHYGEYGSRGPGAVPGERVAWSKQLQQREAMNFTLEAVFGGDTGWTR
ncbi:pectin methylesterase [Paenibacillus sp. PK3_47]|uniref:pectinesterase family protein n=1 Tax=Paenibacillus sp. PK3_47 TaxID=2072642 RepID=UPI00201DE5E4|nr:pectinesterase family protein [Paenibacillus sp. PK3_47]UQZ32166.1 pectin methylesterase [Paenibacillus sp. PK3_47]